MKRVIRLGVAHAVAATLVLVCLPRRAEAADTIDGRAVGVEATTNIIVAGVPGIPVSILLPESNLPTPTGGSDSDSAASASLGVTLPLGLGGLTVLSTGVLETSSSGAVNPTSVTSTATVNDLNVLNGLIQATTIQAQSSSSCNNLGTASSSSSGTLITGLVIDGTSYTLTSGTINLVGVSVTLAGLTAATVSGSVVINTQTTSGNGITTSGLNVDVLTINLTVTALAVLTPVSIPLTATISAADSEVTCMGSPTRADMLRAMATDNSDGVTLSWRTGYEQDNLGFNIYREENGARLRVNPGLIAGSALFAAAGTSLSAGQSYLWRDPEARTTDGSNFYSYWIEAVDLDGSSVWHGPIPVESGDGEGLDPGQRPSGPSPLLHRLGSLNPDAGKTEMSQPSTLVLPRPDARGFTLAVRRAVKIGVTTTGWHRLSQPELLAAGLSAAAEPRRLQLYVDGREQAIRVRGEEDGALDAEDVIEFYGTRLDTPATDTRVYWLIEGQSPGARIFRRDGGGGGSPSATSFPYTVERRDRVVYFPGLFNGDEENFFGPVVHTQRLTQTLLLRHVVGDAPEEARLDVSLQGATTGAHRVRIGLNGAELGELNFAGHERGRTEIAFAQSRLREGENAVTLESLGGAGDASLVHRLQLSYRHAFRAEDDLLHLTAEGGSAIRIGGFSGDDLLLFDVTAAEGPVELSTTVVREGDGYAMTARVPESGERRLLALGSSRALRPASLTANRPSNWRAQIGRADLIVIGHRNFLPALAPLTERRRSQGLLVAIIDVEDVYDEFSFGHKSPAAIQDLLLASQRITHSRDKHVLLVGDASLDPRNYLGAGQFDFVPTKLLQAGQIETASDDWFADFDFDGAPEMAVGRLPARTLRDADVMVAKTLRYESLTAPPSATLITDVGDVFDFEGAAGRAQAALPAEVVVETIRRGQMEAAAARTAVLSSLGRGPRLVNYFGHGSRDFWRGELLTASDAARLANQQSPSVVVSLSCLNGLFQDITIESLAESLLKSEGGAAIVWASSGLTGAGEQTLMNQEFIRQIYGHGARTFGEAARRAKAAISDRDVRRSWIFFGDPSLPTQN